MALPETRYLVRMRISDVERRVEVDLPVHASRHPSETLASMHLRLLAYALAYTPTLAFGPGLSSADAPTIVDKDATGDIVHWIACGAPDWMRVQKAVRANSRARVDVFAGDARKHARMMDEAAGVRGIEDVHVTLVSPELVAALGRRDERRSTWAVTIVEGHLYVDADGAAVDGPWDRVRVGDRVVG